MHELYGFIFSPSEFLIAGQKMLPELLHTGKMVYQLDCTADNCQTLLSHPSQSHWDEGTSSPPHYSPKSVDLWKRDNKSNQSALSNTVYRETFPSFYYPPFGLHRHWVNSELGKFFFPPFLNKKTPMCLGEFKIWWNNLLIYRRKNTLLKHCILYNPLKVRHVALHNSTIDLRKH